MALRDLLNEEERAVLAFIMRGDPVRPSIIDPKISESLLRKSLIERYSDRRGWWKVNWERVKNGGKCGCDICRGR